MAVLFFFAVVAAAAGNVEQDHNVGESHRHLEGGSLIIPATSAPSPPSITAAKIAYVFAGSARSFVCPKVHWSIRLNLIDAFGGDPHVFVRLTNEDNQNTKTGKGKLQKPKYAEGEVEEALKILHPKEVEYFSLSNQLSEMQENYPGVRHDIFRANDLRRYSMFWFPVYVQAPLILLS